MSETATTTEYSGLDFFITIFGLVIDILGIVFCIWITCWFYKTLNGIQRNTTVMANGTSSVRINNSEYLSVGKGNGAV
jgi:hypothetical protein